MRSRPRQLPLKLDHTERLTRDDLVVTPANAQAVALIDDWLAWPSATTILAGPPGSGKSHLASIWQSWSGATRLEAIALSDRTVDADRPILIDGIGDQPFDQKGLFHIINAVRGAKTHLLMTTRRFPAAWNVDLPDLASRLKAATIVEIREPDDALLTGVITKLFADRQVEVDFPVVEFLARRMERSLSSAIDLVDRLDRMALEQKTRISRILAAEVLAKYDAETGHSGPSTNE